MLILPLYAFAWGVEPAECVDFNSQFNSQIVTPLLLVDQPIVNTKNHFLPLPKQCLSATLKNIYSVAWRHFRVSCAV